MNLGTFECLLLWFQVWTESVQDSISGNDKTIHRRIILCVMLSHSFCTCMFCSNEASLHHWLCVLLFADDGVYIFSYSVYHFIPLPAFPAVDLLKSISELVLLYSYIWMAYFQFHHFHNLFACFLLLFHLSQSHFRAFASTYSLYLFISSTLFP